MITLKTSRLIIRDPHSSDISGWHSLMSDPKTMHYLQDIMTHTKEESRKNLETAIAEAQNPNRTKYFFTIEHIKTGDFIGSIGYTVTSNLPMGKVVGVGYFILPEYHGQGYITETMREIIRFAFEDNNVFRIETGCLSENKASERVMQKCGLIKEADRRNAQWHDGQMKDRVEYRLLKDEWQPANIGGDTNQIHATKKADNSIRSQATHIDDKSDALQKTNNPAFWQTLDKLILQSKTVIDRPKDTPHPHYPDFIYPLNYGYLENTASMDGGGIDIWQGSNPTQELDAIVCIADLTKRDSEIKLLIGCTDEEKAQVYQLHNKTNTMKGILIHRAK